MDQSDDIKIYSLLLLPGLAVVEVFVYFNIIYRTVSNTTSPHFLLEMLTIPVFVRLYTAESPL